MKAGRPPTGSPCWSKERTRWEARVTLPGTNGKKRRVPLRGIAESDVAGAKLAARQIAKRVHDGKSIALEDADPDTARAIKRHLVSDAKRLLRTGHADLFDALLNLLIECDPKEAPMTGEAPF